MTTPHTAHRFYNPKAAALYAHLFLVTGATVFLFAAFRRLKLGAAFFYYSIDSKSIDTTQIVLYAVIACCALWYFVSMWAYLARLFAAGKTRSKFATRVAACVCALPCFSPFALAWQSLRTRSGVSAWCCAGQITVVFAAVCEAAADVSVLSVELYFVLFVALNIFAIYFMRDAQVGDAWAFIPITFSLVVYGALLYANLSAGTQLAKAEARLAVAAPTREELANSFTNGVVVYDEEVRKTIDGIRDIPYPKSRHISLLDADDVAAYDEAFAAHADAIAKVDALVSRPDLSFAFVPADSATPFSAWGASWTSFHAPLFHGGTTLYRNRMLRESVAKNVAGVLDANAKMVAIFNAHKTPYVSLNYYASIAVENLRLYALQRIIPELDDATLRELQAQRERHVADVYRRAQKTLVCEWMLQCETIARIRARNFAPLRGLPRTPDKRFRLLLYDAWQTAELLDIAHAFDEQFENFCAAETAPAPASGFGNRSAAEDSDSETGALSLVFAAKAIRPHTDWHDKYLDFNELSELFRVAVDIELYRRKHDKLPDTLDALVPEFMPRVPTSFATGKPFAYEKGELTFTEKDGEEEIEKTFTGFRVTGGSYNKRFDTTLSYEVVLDEALVR